MSHEHDHDREHAADAASSDALQLRSKRPAGVDRNDIVQMLGTPLHSWDELPQLGVPRDGGRESHAQIPAGMTIADLMPTSTSIQHKNKKEPEAGPSRDDLSPDVRDNFSDVPAATNLKSRIVMTTVEGGRTRLRFAAGGHHGVKPRSPVKLHGLRHDDILIDKIDGDSSFAFTDLPIDSTRSEGRGREVTINPRATTTPKSKGALQKRASAEPARESVHQAAARGVSSPSTSLPFLDQIQASFGRAHDVSGIQAHIGGDSAAAMGAEAYATGNHVVFDRAPDLHTAAHEAAHVIQQRRGVQLAGGVGQAGDSYEQHADAVADRVVQGKSAADLLGQPDAADGADAQDKSDALGIQHKPGATPAPAKAAVKGPDQKAGSWVHPSLKAGNHLVGKIFFRTKDSTIDAHDRALLAELARAYAGNKKTPVKGTFDGFADPRPSHRPANNDLSHARAGTVARELLHAFASTNAWYENVTARGRGVDPAALTIEAEEGFEDVHAPYRRVDVYLDGKADAELVKQNVVADDRPKVPDYSDRPTPWEDDNGYQIERGNKDHIEGVALRILRNTAWDGPDDTLDATLRGMGVYGSVVRDPRELPKPPWWDARIRAQVHDRGGIPHYDNHGFDEQDLRPEYVRRASQLVKDYQLYLNYRDDRKGDVVTWANSGFKDARRIPDGKNLEKRLGYLRFMINTISDEAEAIRKMTK